MPPPLKIKKRAFLGPSNSLLGIYPMKMKTLTQKGVCIPIFIAALDTNSQDIEITQMSNAQEWTMKLWLLRIMEYYVAVRKDEVTSSATLCGCSYRAPLNEKVSEKTNIRSSHSSVA